MLKVLITANLKKKKPKPTNDKITHWYLLNSAKNTDSYSIYLVI